MDEDFKSLLVKMMNALTGGPALVSCTGELTPRMAMNGPGCLIAGYVVVAPGVAIVAATTTPLTSVNCYCHQWTVHMHNMHSTEHTPPTPTPTYYCKVNMRVDWSRVSIAESGWSKKMTLCPRPLPGWPPPPQVTSWKCAVESRTHGVLKCAFHILSLRHRKPCPCPISNPPGARLWLAWLSGEREAGSSHHLWRRHKWQSKGREKLCHPN